MKKISDMKGVRANPLTSDKSPPLNLRNVKPKFVKSEFLAKRGQLEKENSDVNVTVESIRKSATGGQVILSSKSLAEVPPCVWQLELPDRTPSRLEVKMDNSETDEIPWWQREPITRLILGSNQLKSISDDIKLLCNLVVLDLHDNQISSLPDGLADCLKIQRLYLSYNKLTSIPLSVCKLNDLRVLKVDHNNLVSLPKEISDLCYLQELDASNNEIASLPADLNGLRVHKLMLSNNKIRSLPQMIGWLQSLRVLDLSENELGSLIAEVGELRKLEQLYLNRNQLTFLPPLKDCENLKELFVAGNQMVLVEEFFERLPALVVCDMRENKLRNLPMSVTKCAGLERLLLESNDLSSIPPELALMPKLTTLSIDKNPLRTIRKDVAQRGTAELLKYLRSKLSESDTEEFDHPESSLLSPRTYDILKTKCLDYSDRKLTEVPEDILSVLLKEDFHSVNLSKNLFSVYPSSLSLLADKIMELNLSNNQLTELGCAIGQLKQLRLLDIRSNGLSSLPLELKNCELLRELIVSFNKLSVVPPVVYELSNLEVLVLHDNQIDVLDAVKLQRLSMLSTMDLSNNSIRAVPPELGLITSLKSLNIGGNLFKVPRAELLAKGTGEVLKYLRSRLPTA